MSLGGIGNFDYTILLCAKMEEAGKAGDMNGLNLLLPQFEAELAGVDAYIDSKQL